MSFGKLYGYAGNPRTTGLLAVAHENKLDVELVTTKPRDGVSDDYRKLNKLGRIPTFHGSDNYVLSEVLAIAVYFASQNEKTTLLGKDKKDYASILRWISFANTEVLSKMAGWFRPLIGFDPYNKKSIEDAKETTNKSMKVLEDHLMINTYLVGERITLADIIAAGMVARGMEFVLDKQWREGYPSLTRWWTTIVNQPFWKAANGEAKMCEEAVKYTPPAKEKAPPQPKKEQAKPKAKAKEPEDDEEEEAAPAPKPKHPLDELPKASVPIDEWKRKYKNEDTREVALPWFWENMPFTEYSIWQVDYKYNDELTLTFMTSNLIGGFFARLEASRKFIMGCASVYGENKDSVVRGAFVIRGQEALKAFDVAPDYESYEFTKLDPKKAEDRDFFDNMMAWDKPIEVNGKTYQWADGKVFV